MVGRAWQLPVQLSTLSRRLLFLLGKPQSFLGLFQRFFASLDLGLRPALLGDGRVEPGPGWRGSLRSLRNWSS